VKHEIKSLEKAAASNHDWMRDQHWRSIFHHCTPCANEFDFIVKQESAAEDQVKCLSRE
jgi:hypothetical protein